MKMLDKINNPQDLKSLSISELSSLSEEIRNFIIDNISKIGGHLASSLGAVELIVSLHHIFNTPEDKIIYDVGHQAYAHKIITGRKNKFHTLRQLNGISGFIRPEESEYDTFISGHASTAISAALGMAVARDINNKSNKIVTVIGDGTLTGGLSYEALNNAHFIKNFIIILNDNKMAIANSVGAMAKYLNKIITSPLYNRVKKDMENIINKIPSVGPAVVDIGKRIEEGLKGVLVPGILFEELGFRYFGPVDGHNMLNLITMLKKVKDIQEPVILHVLTKKGRGFKHAEEEPEDYHGTTPFYITDGNDIVHKPQSTIPSYTEVFSSTLCKLAKYDPKIIAITAAMEQGTGLDKFRELFPKRFFDVGIAEEHAVTFSAGTAINGLHPVVAIYSTFLQRAYDQIVIDVCLQKLPVLFAIDRAGLVGEDGPTHHGVFDIAYMRHIPNLVMMQPKDENELQHMIYTALNYNGPVSIRYPRATGIGTPLETQFQNLDIGKSELIFEGNNGVIIALGPMVNIAKETIKILRKEGIQMGLVNARFIKPLDEKLLLECANHYPYIFTIEDHSEKCGFGSAVLELFSKNNIQANCKSIGIPDKFITHGKISELRELLGLTPEAIANTIKTHINNPPHPSLKTI
jgi:1-deoxy-D-xylulose-5-phosphate synthase